MLISVTVGLVLVMLYCLWRWKRWIHATARYEPLLPPAQQLCWAKPSAILSQSIVLTTKPDTSTGETDSRLHPPGLRSPDPQPAISSQATAASLGAGIDGAFVGVNSLEAFSHVDVDFLSAIEFSTAAHLTGLASIDSYLEAHFFDASTSSAEGWLHRLEGYVAEQKVAAAFENAGKVVQFAPTPNQESWDLLVDGRVFWQVKEGIYTTGIREALSQHGDIPIATGTDLAGQLNEPLVRGFEALNQYAIAAATKDSLLGVKEGFHPGLKIPIFTVALSSWREYKLLRNKKTTFDRAWKSVAIDVVGVGAGMAGGAKLGALLLSWTGPLGAGIGALVFGIGGAIVGRAASHAYRFEHFNQAYAEYQVMYEKAEAAVHKSIEGSREEVRRLGRNYEEEYLAARTDIEARVKAQFETERRMGDEELDRFAAQFPAHLANLRKTLQTEERMVLGTKPRSRWWGILLPGAIELERAVISRWFQRARARVEQEQLAYDLLRQAGRSSRILEIRRFLIEYEFQLQSLEEDVNSLNKGLEKRRKKGRCLHEQAVAEATATRDQLIQALALKVVAIRDSVGQLIDSWTASLGRIEEKVRTAATPLGVNLPS